MPARAPKPVEANDGSYAGEVLAAYDRLTKAEPDYAAERRLPDGRSCRHCVHADRCDGLFGAVRREFKSCDFWPSRFVLASRS